MLTDYVLHDLHCEGIFDPENAIAVFPTEPTPLIENEESWDAKIKQQPTSPTNPEKEPIKKDIND